jgi:hypothetical protein
VVTSKLQPRFWTRWSLPTRIGVLGGGVAAAVLLAVVILLFWTGASAVNVTFVNNTANEVSLPDCSTDIATIPAGQTTHLPVAWDHPARCTVDGANAVIGCVTLPNPIPGNLVVRLSDVTKC